MSKSNRNTYTGPLSLTLVSRNRRIPVKDFDEAEALIRRDSLESDFNLEIEATSNSGKQPSKFETWIYRFLGAPLEDDVRRISVCANQGDALVVYEQNDREFVPQAEGGDDGQSIQMHTGAGEPFLVSKRDCIPVLDAIELAREFIGTRRRPKAIRWRVSR